MELRDEAFLLEIFIHYGNRLIILVNVIDA